MSPTLDLLPDTPTTDPPTKTPRRRLVLFGVVAGLLLVAASPSTAAAAVFLFGYVAARMAHTWAYLTEQDHEVRAACFTVGAALTAGMVIYAGTVALWH